MRNKGALPHFEALLPPFLDLVVWGHEHECRQQCVATAYVQQRQGGAAGAGEGEEGEGIPVDDGDRSTYILQPGSTVATSLTPGEAAQKCAFLLQVKGAAFRTLPLPLSSVRPLVMGEVSLAGEAGLTLGAPDAGARVEAFLRAQVEGLLKDAEEALGRLPPHARPPPSMRTPLIRLRVEHSGFATLPAARFGSAFSGRVANPGDVLLFWRRPKPRAALPAAGAGASSSRGAGLQPVAPQELSNVTLEDLVSRYLEVRGRVGETQPANRATLLCCPHIGTHSPLLPPSPSSPPLPAPRVRAGRHSARAGRRPYAGSRRLLPGWSRLRHRAGGEGSLLGRGGQGQEARQPSAPRE